MKIPVWHKVADDTQGIEVSRQRFVALLGVLGLIGIAVSLGQGDFALFAVIIAVPVVFMALLAMLSSPLVMFFAVFVFNYFVMGFMRYVDSGGISVLMDIFLWLQLLLIITHKVLKRDHEWGRAVNLLTVMSLVWTLYCVLELVNPSAVFEAWLMSRRLIYQGFMMALIVSLLFTYFKQVRWLVILYSVLTLLAIAKVLIQYKFGFDDYEMAWLINSESIKTHILYGGSVIRYFSFFTDAGNFGSNMGCAGIIFMILALYEKKPGLRIYYCIVGLLSIYAMFLSGTRGAMIVPLAGLALYTVLSKNFKAMAAGGLLLAGLYVFFAFTYIGEGNPLIRRMRTAFRPSEDASFQVRMHNQAALREYLKSKPFGEGVGLGGVENRKYAYRVTTMIPHDSWYVKIWMETGIIGLILYVGILVAVMFKCCYTVMYKIKHRLLCGYLIALLCGTFGLLVSAYGNAFLGQFPTMLIVFTFLGIAIRGSEIESATLAAGDPSAGKPKVIEQ